MARRGGGIGRRKGLKILRFFDRAGSSPAPGTKFLQKKFDKFFLFYSVQVVLVVSVSCACEADRWKKEQKSGDSYEQGSVD